MRAAASRTFCTAGKSRPTNTPMIAITTSRSISVKPPLRLVRIMASPPQRNVYDKGRTHAASHLRGLWLFRDVRSQPARSAAGRRMGDAKFEIVRVGHD